mmetsp:Transcript_6982/g.16843  ORF Transcript_6982/g.16843 Transcript_6982/m.16843 type:complete len:213 (+) Transcript_6982:1184-1822(+)
MLRSCTTSAVVLAASEAARAAATSSPEACDAPSAAMRRSCAASLLFSVSSSCEIRISASRATCASFALAAATPCSAAASRAASAVLAAASAAASFVPTDERRSARATARILRSSVVSSACIWRRSPWAAVTASRTEVTASCARSTRPFWSDLSVVDAPWRARIARSSIACSSSIAEFPAELSRSAAVWNEPRARVRRTERSWSAASSAVSAC